MSRLDRLFDRHAELLYADDRLVVHLAELHAPDRESGPVPICNGCDHLGNRREAAHWPCRTWTLLAEEVER